VPLPLTREIKDPQATLDYTVDWSAWFKAGSTDTIASAVWILTPGITKVSQSLSATTATIKVSGGALGKVYTVTCRVTTVAGLTDDYSFEILVADK